MTRPSTSSRRIVLRVGAGLTASALAGCTGSRSSDPTTERSSETTTTTEEPTTRTTETREAPPQAAWQVELDGKVELGPVVRDGTVYVGSETGVFRALDPEDGTQRWKFDTGASFFFGTGTRYSPLVADDTVFTVSGNRSGAHGDQFAVYALNARTGEKRWSMSEGFPNFLSLLGVAGGRAFVATSDDSLSDAGETLYALDAKSGETLWTAEIGDADEAAVTPDAAYVAARTRFDAFGTAEGTRRWSRSFDGHLLGPEVGGDVMYAGFRSGSDSSAALALDPESGETRWSVDDGFVTSLLADESLYVGGENVASFAPDGTERWRYDAGGLLTDAALTGDRIYSSGDRIAALDSGDGSEQWHYSVDAEFGAVEGADEEVVAVQRENRPVVDVVDAESGQKQFTFEAGGRQLSAVGIASGTVCVGSDGTVYALRAD
jgi:outer membrane protein assembly factor BamB